MKTLLFLLLPVFAAAQNWAPIGAKWTFTQKTANPNYYSYTTFESVADDTVGGLSCKAIRVIARHSPVTTDTSWRYMYSDSGRVYFWGDTAWCLLHDFNTALSDSFHLGCHFTDVNRHQSVIITSLDTVIINGHSRKLFGYESPSFWSEYSGLVIEGIGHVLYMFPVHDQVFPIYTPGPLRCYEDSIIGLYKNQYHYSWAWTEDCDKILTGIEEVERFSVKVFPNPVTTNKLQVEGLTEGGKIQLLDVLGSVLISKAATSTMTLDLSGIANGTYFLRATTASGLTITKRILKSRGQ